MFFIYNRPYMHRPSHYNNILFSCCTALLYKIFIICSFTALAVELSLGSPLYRISFLVSRFLYSAKLSQNALNFLLLLSGVGHPPPPLPTASLYSHPQPHFHPHLRVQCSRSLLPAPNLPLPLRLPSYRFPF